MQDIPGLPSNKKGFEQGGDGSILAEGSDMALDRNKGRSGDDQSRSWPFGVVTTNGTPGSRPAKPVKMDAGTEYGAAGGDADMVCIGWNNGGQLRPLIQ